MSCARRFGGLSLGVTNGFKLDGFGFGPKDTGDGRGFASKSFRTNVRFVSRATPLHFGTRAGLLVCRHRRGVLGRRASGASLGRAVVHAGKSIAKTVGSRRSIAVTLTVGGFLCDKCAGGVSAKSRCFGGCAALLLGPCCRLSGSS